MTTAGIAGLTDLLQEITHATRSLKDVSTQGRWLVAGALLLQLDDKLAAHRDRFNDGTSLPN